MTEKELRYCIVFSLLKGASQLHSVYLVLVSLLVEGPRRRRMATGRKLAGVLAHLREAVHLADRAQHLLGLLLVLLLPAPCLQDRRLQSAGEREGDIPGRVRHVLGHRLNVQRRVLLRLATREESDPGHRRRNGLLHHVKRVLGDLWLSNLNLSNFQNTFWQTSGDSFSAVSKQASEHVRSFSLFLFLILQKMLRNSTKISKI